MVAQEGPGGSREEGRSKHLAWTAVIVYPIGLWALCSLLLLRASGAIIDEKQTSLSRAITFLWSEYDTHCLWWELMEMLRKFLLVGLFVVVKPGSILQIAIGATVCAIYLVCSAPKHL